MSEKNNAVKFVPVRGLDSRIKNNPVSDGHVYFATDTGKIYVDSQGKRVTMGTAGAAIYYGLNEKPTEEEGYFYLSFDDVSGAPKAGDLILNKDGGFYKVDAITQDGYACVQVSVSGTGGGGIVAKKQPSCTIKLDSYNFINGRPASFHIKAESAKDANDEPIDTTLNVYYELYSADEVRYFSSRPISFETGVADYDGVVGVVDTDIDISENLQHSRTSILKVWVEASNHDTPKSYVRSATISNSELTLSKSSGWKPTTRYPVSGFSINCSVVGSINKIVEFYYDDMNTPAETAYISQNVADSVVNFNVSAQDATHGYHTVCMRLYQNLGTEQKPKKGFETDPLKYEIAVIDENNVNAKPVIWLGDYSDQYYNYDTIQIRYLVYDPSNTSKALVHLYKDKVEIEGSPRTIEDFSEYNVWEIADAEMGRLNSYQISCGETDQRKVEREVSFRVVKDPDRDMTVLQDNLLLDFSATGRSNDEAPAKRKTWSYELKANAADPDGSGVKKSAIFDKFTWTSKNGWNVDPEINQTRLSISNGATLTIPFKAMEFAKNTAGKNSHTIEMQIRIRNIQKYGNLITNITRYENDTAYYNAFIAQSRYDNYDAYLQATLKPDEYEGLKFFRVQKDIQINNVVGGLYDYDSSSKSVVGFCIGTQDAFFSNGQDTVNVNFVENELINLSFVYQHGLKLLYIYINGVITGVIRSFEGANQSFQINNTNIVFNSQHCDIDLYKLRIYNSDLNVSQIVTNFAIDRRDVATFDQSNKYAFASENKALQEYQISYDKIVEYNIANPNNPTMPYIIFDTGVDSLPYSKDDKKKIKVEFINAPLEAAYASGELETLAREDGLILEGATTEQIQEGIRTYYKHHCPSWTSTIRTGDLVNFEVQGTSSEFYPRRNYKIKTKMDGNFNWSEAEQKYEDEDALNIFMHKGPFAEMFELDKAEAAADVENKFPGKERTRMSDGWYMNNYTNPTDRWTMKVDYMESSGSYNAGFASLAGNAYTKHPLQDHLSNLSGTDKLKPVISSSKYSTIQWKDYRTSLLGFPVMAFQKVNGKHIFIGYYRMLLDKSSTQVLGFKPNKNVKHKLFPTVNKDGQPDFMPVRDIAECWEFSNNARGFCSFRDPWNRVELSFLGPQGVSNEWTAKGAPVVANSFEYRYHSKGDALDALYTFNEQSQSDLDGVAKDLGLTKGDVVAGDKYSGAEAFMLPHRNWEKLVKWVWSTNLDAVASQGTYSYVLVSDTVYTPNKYYKLDHNNKFELATGAFDEDIQYYVSVTDENDKVTYNPIRLCAEENKYAPNKYYYQVAGQNTTDDKDDVFALATEAFSNQIDYYIFITDTENVLNEKFDLLIRKVDPTTETFSTSTQYYTYDGSVEISYGRATGAVQPVNNPSASDFANGLYYVANPVQYANMVYTHDSKEYRAAKFTNEFDEHFDPEYVAAYFVLTEVMELYDSRGKNCMIASWGPTEEGGEYIWYPIFYDIDTQLGINNTGIPSFQFNVDATEAGNFSTSDSILWNNFYKFFKDIWMIPKYRNLRGNDSKFAKLEEITEKGAISTAPLQSVDYIEKWYSFNPDVTKNIACRGIRPKLATNLDMYFKYITICNPEAKNQGVAHLGGEGSNGAFAEPDTGTYFYALQGDRSQSRRQFVESRLDYIDSWLVQGNYARAGQNRLWGRISANNRSDKDVTGEIVDVHSDKWTETNNDYWVDGIEFGTKVHEFDAEYWLEPSPIRSSYFTAGDDSMNYPSKKYDGVNKFRFKLAELENGIRRSDNYSEQLLYIYGTDKMSDFGDLSKMYWTEFKIQGSADKLVRLKLGHDGLTHDFPSDTATTKADIGWYNKKLNNITLPSQGLPLLKEANFCNITLTADKPLDLSQSDKLENFRATGSSGITGVTFAKGVALNTLYLPSNIGTLSLDGAGLLTDLIGYTDANGNEVASAKYQIPTMIDGALVAKPGLYLENFFNGDSALRNISLKGGALGYNSFRLLKRLYEKYRGTNNTAKITMTDVNWCPYTQLGEGDIYDASKTYYIDNGHYGFKTYTNVGAAYSESQFNTDILSGKLYCDNRENSAFNDDVLFIDKNTIEMLKRLYENSNFIGADNTPNPEITGIIYIHNDGEAIEETVISDTLQKYYPHLTFFFKEVTPAYSATFVLIDKESGAEGWVDHKTETGYGPSVQKIKRENMTAANTTYFGNPYELYKVERTHWDFYGWATTPTGTKVVDGQTVSSIIIGNVNDSMSEADKIKAHDKAWKDSKAVVFKEDQIDYPFYAILTEHEYSAVFKDVFNSAYTQVSKTAFKETGSFMNDDVPAPSNNGATSLYMRNSFKGWTNDIEKAKVIYPSTMDDADLPLINVADYPATRDYEFYAIYKEESVFGQVADSKYFNFEYLSSGAYSDRYDDSYTVSTGYSISVKDEYRDYLSGKITIPVVAPDGKPVIRLGNMANNTITHVFFDQSHPNEIREISSKAFQFSGSLEYIDFENMPKLRWIRRNSVSGCPKYTNFKFKNPLARIDGFAFDGSGSGVNDKAYDIEINSMLRELSANAIQSGCRYGTIYVGTATEPSQLEQSSWNLDFYAQPIYGASDAIIYCSKETEAQWNEFIAKDIFAPAAYSLQVV